MAKTLITPTQQNRAASKFDVDASKFTYHPPENIPENEQTTDSEGNRASIRAGYYTDPSGKIVNRIDETYTTGDQDYGQQLETHAGPSTYQIPVKVGNQEFSGTFEENGNFRVGYGKEFYQNGHHWLPVLDAQGKISYTNNDQTDGFADFAKMVALSALTAGIGGAAGLGESLYGLSGTAGQLAGGATLGAGRAALSGGNLEDVIKGGLTGGALSGFGGQEIGDTGVNVGQAVQGIQAIQSKNPLAIISAASSLLSPSGTTGPNSKDIEPNSFPSTGNDQFPQPFTVAPSEQTPIGGLNATSSPLSDILPAAGKILKGFNTVKGLTNSMRSGPLGAISALTQIAKSNAPQASQDKLPAPRADVRNLYQINNAPAYVPTSQLIPLDDFESLNKLLTG